MTDTTSLRREAMARFRAAGKCSTDSVMRHYTWAVMEEDAHGDYVMWSHVEQLVAALEAAEADLARVTDERDAGWAVADDVAEKAKCLEWASEHLAATRTHEVYLAMIDSGQSDAMLSLDSSRQALRTALAAHAKHKEGRK